VGTSWHCYFIDITFPYISLVTQIDALVQLEDVAHMCYLANLKAKWLILMFKFITIYIDTFMNNVDQGNEIIEHITLKRRPPITKHAVHIPFTYRSSLLLCNHKQKHLSIVQTYSKDVLPLIVTSLHLSPTKFPH